MWQGRVSGQDCCLLTVWLDVSAEAPVDEVDGLVAALPQGQEDCNAAGRDGDHEGQHNHKAEVGLAPIGPSRQRQQRPHNLGEGEGNNGADPNLHHTIPSCCSPQLQSTQGDNGTDLCLKNRCNLCS